MLVRSPPFFQCLCAFVSPVWLSFPPDCESWIGTVLKLRTERSVSKCLLVSEIALESVIGSIMSPSVMTVCVGCCLAVLASFKVENYVHISLWCACVCTCRYCQHAGKNETHTICPRHSFLTWSVINNVATSLPSSILSCYKLPLPPCQCSSICRRDQVNKLTGSL